VFDAFSDFEPVESVGCSDMTGFRSFNDVQYEQESSGSAEDDMIET